MTSDSRAALVRCGWAKQDDPLYVDYHDREWGVPLHDDRQLLEFLTLEGAQAGLSWATILRKREAYRRAFANFDPATVAGFNPSKIRELLGNPGLVRNRQKIESAIGNARATLAIQREFGSLDSFLWQVVEHRTIRNRWTSLKQIPARTPLSEQMSQVLRNRGFNFVGPTICYAFMQAVGMVNDHLVSCFRHDALG